MTIERDVEIEKHEESLEKYYERLFNDRVHSESELLRPDLASSYGEALLGSEFEGLEDSQKQKCVNFLGRLSFFTQLYVPVRFRQSVFAELRNLKEAANLDDGQLLSFYNLCSMVEARYINSNTHGAQGDLLKSVLGYLPEEKINNFKDELYNPFHLEGNNSGSRGTEFLVFEKGKGTTRFQIAEILREEAEGIYTVSGDKETYDYQELNKGLVSGKYCLEDGSNFFGGRRELLKECGLPEIIPQKGQRFRITTHVNTVDYVSEGVCKGTTLDEYNERLGEFFLNNRNSTPDKPFFKIKMLINGETEVVEFELSNRSTIEILD